MRVLIFQEEQLQNTEKRWVYNHHPREKNDIILQEGENNKINPPSFIFAY
jgi:hypothetical protein